MISIRMVGKPADLLIFFYHCFEAKLHYINKKELKLSTTTTTYDDDGWEDADTDPGR